MINAIGLGSGSAIDTAKLRESGKSAPSGSVSGRKSGADGVSPSPAARMAAEGAPIDMDRIGAIKAAIASGNYPVDADAIAQKMLDLDLPQD
ncbi:flagellar biosynthesis anti-sigma factor FlgM [Sphingobium algorifonticola]|uniref:Negative regulator of flagellin synthesis n=1 Tax=Sphingobium algorifonticola TaxID=2008318 RepID=A0A437JBR6_9SPHN|nr:flagellar biosynthesis anti-sigma factor FlgM [Sphingobium algorifonticola]RVT43347.1 flagellar biosynthesis anti-sigma factor FlgM [Sphingobium algorifonticola]